MMLKHDKCTICRWPPFIGPWLVCGPKVSVPWGINNHVCTMQQLLCCTVSKHTQTNWSLINKENSLKYFNKCSSDKMWDKVIQTDNRMSIVWKDWSSNKMRQFVTARGEAWGWGIHRQWHPLRLADTGREGPVFKFVTSSPAVELQVIIKWFTYGTTIHIYVMYTDTSRKHLW